MHPNIDELLALQADDNRISDIEKKIAALAPRLKELDSIRQKAADAVQRTESAIESEQQRQRDISARVELHKKQQERNLAQLDSIKKMKEATAAMSQVETTRRLVAEDESELAAMGRRTETMRADVERTRAALTAAEEEQASARGGDRRGAGHARSRAQGSARRAGWKSGECRPVAPRQVRSDPEP
jgi:predicted  nucleic acid-binding Zn-ribbon protein